MLWELWHLHEVKVHKLTRPLSLRNIPTVCQHPQEHRKEHRINTRNSMLITINNVQECFRLIQFMNTSVMECLSFFTLKGCLTSRYRKTGKKWLYITSSLKPLLTKNYMTSIAMVKEIVLQTPVTVASGWKASVLKRYFTVPTFKINIKCSFSSLEVRLKWKWPQDLVVSWVSSSS